MMPLFWLLCIGLAFASSTTAAATFSGRVVGVSDGDKVTVLDVSKGQHRIRLAGIDAPEKRQAFGERSRQHLASLVFGKEVRVEGDKRDKYKRIVGKVTVDHLDVGLRQVKSGFAWHYKKYEAEQSQEDQHLYAEAEEQARSAKLGLWQQPNPVPPWEWRHADKTPVQLLRVR